MIFKQLGEMHQMLHRQWAVALDLDTATYCKIEKGDRRAKREQIPMIAGILQTDAEELLILWLADNIMEVLEGEKELAEQTLKVVIEKINR